MPKEMDLDNLYKDLGFALHGLWLHEFLFALCPPEGATVLEPGCGSGKMGIHYALRGARETVLIDIDPSMVEYATRLSKATAALAGRKLGIAILEGSIFHLPYADNTFDLVFNEGIPHHWPDEERRQGSIDAMARVSRGWVCVIGSNALCPETMKMAEETSHTYAGMPPKQKPFTPEELSGRLKKAGLVKVDVMPAIGSFWSESTLIVGWGRKG